jgi:Ca-activated chloride channel homolog
MSAVIGFHSGLSCQLPALALALACGAYGQTTYVPVTFRATTDMVLVPVTVTDHNGKTVEGLRPENFTVLDERTPQRIVSFVAQDAPCSVGLVLDISGSMRDTLATGKDVARAILEASNPRDEFFLMTVSSKPQLNSDFTSDAGALENSLQSAGAGGWTALIDTVYLSLTHMHKARRPRRALVVLSDGIDNRSQYLKGELMEMALEADTQIYTIVVDNSPPNRKAIELTEERRGRELLMDLAERTGGCHLTVRNRGEAQAAAVKIAQAIRNEYVIGYRPQPSKTPGKWRHIRVLADVRGINVYARNGYFGR